MPLVQLVLEACLRQGSCAVSVQRMSVCMVAVGVDYGPSQSQQRGDVIRGGPMHGSGCWPLLPRRSRLPWLPWLQAQCRC